MRSLSSLLALLLVAGCTSKGGDADTSAPTDTADTSQDTDTAETGVDGVSEILIPIDAYYPEGIAIDPATNTLYVGSFGTGAIHAASLADGTVQELVGPWGAGGALTGLKVADGALWACVNVPDVTTAPSSLAKFDLATGALEGSWPLELYTFCNDLVVMPNGDVLATDSYLGVVFVLPEGGEATERWLADPAYTPVPGNFGFNGIVASADAATILLGRFDTGDLVRVAVNPDGSAGASSIDTIDTPIAYAGIDGLAWKDDVLYAARDFQVVALTGTGGTWSSTPVDGSLDWAATLAVDPDGGVWAAETQFTKLFDGDDSTNGVAPYRVVKVQ